MSLETVQGFGLVIHINQWQVQEKIRTHNGMSVDTQLDVQRGDFLSITAFKATPEPGYLFLEFELYGFVKAESLIPILFLSPASVVILQIIVPTTPVGATAILDVKWYDDPSRSSGAISTMTIQLDIVGDTDKGPITEQVHVV